jgi:hypothetical protein
LGLFFLFAHIDPLANLGFGPSASSPHGVAIRILV